MYKLKRRLLFMLVLPAVYVVALVVITTGQSGVTDHGFGVGPFLDLSMPAGLLGFLAAALFHAEWLLVPVCFLSALAQYALLGYGIDSFLRRRKQRRMDRSAKGG